MKKTIKHGFLIAILNLLFMCTVSGQESYSFMKLLVENDNKEILLVKWEGEWELPGEKYNQPTSIKSFLMKMAETMGITIKNHKIFGLYTQRWKGAEYLTLMQYYSAEYISGDLQVPPECTEIGWFSHEEALTKIPYDNMNHMIRWKEKNPGKIASAAFERFMDENNKTKYKTIENWHSIN